jgi:hypothetical protein
LSLESGRTAIEDEDGLDTEVEQFAYPPEEAYDVGVTQRIAFFVADGFEELVDPDGGVDGEAFTIESWKRCWACGGCEDGPETGNSHVDVVSSRAVEL